MPEGPEIRLTSLYINTVCREKVFSGPPIRSEVSKNPQIPFNAPQYTIHSESRGKELALLLTTSRDQITTSCDQISDIKQDPEEFSLRLLFKFGMSGRFIYTSNDNIPKHAHLSFQCPLDKTSLCFVDTRRFGSWQIVNKGEWGVDRGPDLIDEFNSFRTNIEENIGSRIFDKPICEVMLNQKYFNGIGNYLRAEILYRAGIPPFISARDALTTYPVLYDLCRSVPLEVINLKTDLGKATEATVSDQDYKTFMNWLQCYENPSMENLVDHNKRTIWFKGDPGPLLPKVKISRGKTRMALGKSKKTKSKIDKKSIKKSKSLYHHDEDKETNSSLRVTTRSMSKRLA